MRCIKKLLISQFGDYKITARIYALDVIDEMLVAIMTIELNDLVEKNGALRGRSYYLISSKPFADTNDPDN